MRILANKTDINNTCNRITFLSEEYQDKIKQMNNLLDKIQSCWNGNNSKIFVERVQTECIQNLEDINDVIQSYGEYLKKVYDSYEQIDKY